MKQNMLRTLGLLLSLLLLTGCAMTELQEVGSGNVSLPQPESEGMQAPNTDTVPLRTFDAQLHLCSADGAILMPVHKRLSIDYTQDPALMLMEALIAASEEGMRNPIPQGTRVLSVEHTNGVVTVDLSIDAYNVSDPRELLWMDAAITNTLSSLEGVGHVNLLIGGRKYALDGLGMGALSVENANPTLLWTHSRTELDYIAAGGDYALERNAVIYYPALTGGYLLPVGVEMAFSPEDPEGMLMMALTTLPSDVHGARAAFDFMPTYTVNTVVTESGRRVMKIDFSPDTWEAIAVNEPGKTCAAVALTMISFIPELDGVLFCYDNMLITEFDIDGEVIKPGTGVLTRDALRSHIGTAVELYYGAENHDGLTCVTRVLSPMVEHYPRMLLSMLMEGPAPQDAAASALPEDISIEDVLGLSLQQDVMQVNLSANFYRLCQRLDAAAERRLVYSIVNTLCALDGVNAVQFYVESELAELLSEKIYLRVPLMPNPGLVPAETAVPAAEGANENDSDDSGK